MSDESAVQTTRCRVRRFDIAKRHTPKTYACTKVCCVLMLVVHPRHINPRAMWRCCMLPYPIRFRVRQTQASEVGLRSTAPIVIWSTDQVNVYEQG